VLGAPGVLAEAGCVACPRTGGAKIGSGRSAKKTITAVAVEQNVAKSVGIQIAHGSADCAAARTPMVPRGGSSVIDDALMARNSTIAFEAQGAPPLSRESSLMAFRPKGVAALPMPRMFDAKFMIIADIAGCSAGTSGKRRRISGASQRATASRRPASKAIRISPRKKTITPTSPITSWTADFACSKTAATTSPMRSGPEAAATSNDATTSTSQIALSTGPPEPESARTHPGAGRLLGRRLPDNLGAVKRNGASSRE
jgi:hypothetical protein